MAKSRSLNKVMLIGNLTKDPIIRESSNGVTVATFGVATNSAWRDSSGETRERAEFHNIVVFNKLAEICAQVLGKGMLVYLEGELRTRAKNSSDGKRYYKTEVKINEMVLLNNKDRDPVGLEDAKEQGEELMEKVGNDLPEENTEESAPEPEENDSDDDFNDKDLF